MKIHKYLIAKQLQNGGILFRRSLLLLLFWRQKWVKNSQRMRVILPPPRSLHRAGGGGGNNSDYPQGTDYFNAENKNTNASWRGFWHVNLPMVD